MSPGLSLRLNPLFGGYCEKSRSRSTRKETQEPDGSMESLLAVDYRESRKVGQPGWPDSWIQSRTSISSLNYKWYLTSVVLLWTCLNNWLLVPVFSLEAENHRLSQQLSTAHVGQARDYNGPYEEIQLLRAQVQNSSPYTYTNDSVIPWYKVSVEWENGFFIMGIHCIGATPVSKGRW